MKLLKLIFYILISLFFINTATKTTANFKKDDIYINQYEASECDKIYSVLNNDTKEFLESLEIDIKNPKNILNLKIENILDKIFKNIVQNFSVPFKSFIHIIAIMLICVIFKTFYPKLSEKQVGTVLNLVATLCISIFVLSPILKLITSSNFIIKLASDFIIFCVPIMSAILISSGQPIYAASYNYSVILVSQIIARFSEFFLVPILNVLLGISIVSSISTNLKLDSISKTIKRIIKTILKFFSTIFTSILAIKSIIANSSDNFYSNIFKRVISESVPIIGNMVNDAYSVVKGSLNLLKSSLGVFEIVATIIIFLPILIKCILWIFFINISNCVSDILELKKISDLLKSTSDVIKILVAILTFSIITLIISSAIIFILGGK